MSVPAYLDAEGATGTNGESDTILDFLGFKISAKSPEETSSSNNNFVFIPPESVYYASEYLRLQSEVDSWKEKATKYKLENEELKKQVEQQTQLVNKITKEKTEQIGGFRLGLSQMKRDNSRLTTTLKKFGTANKLYIEKYKKLRSEHENAKQEIVVLKIASENEKKLKEKNEVYCKMLQFMTNFLNNCNNQLQMCTKRLNGDTAELSSNIPQLTNTNLNEVSCRLGNNIKHISAKLGLNMSLDGINLWDNVFFVQDHHVNNGNRGMTENNLQQSFRTISQPQLPASTGIATTNPSSSTSHLIPETGDSRDYQPITSPITPDEVELG